MEFVSYIETRKGKKLLKVFKSKRAVDMFLKKNTDKILSKSGIEKVGSMSKRDWDSKEAKYAVNEGKVHFEKKLKSGNIFQVIDRDTKGMRGTQDKFSMQIVDKRGKVIKHIGSHPSLNGAKKYSNSIKEGKKRYYQQDRVGSAKYTISYHDGKKKHKDGSDFFDIKTFKNQRDLAKFVNGLHRFGFVYGHANESINESINEAKVKRPVNRWLELKNDETMHPHKKMAMGLKELKYQLREVEKFFNWYNKIKTMNELDSQNYWKRTNNHIYTIKEKLIKIAKTIQEIEKWK